MQSALWPTILLFPGVAVLVLIGIILTLKKRAREIVWLEEHGTRIMATVIRIQPLDTPSSFKGHRALMKTVRSMQTDDGASPEHSYLLEAQWVHPQSHRQYTFKRRYSFSRGSLPVAGSVVEVLIDAHHPQRYYMPLQPSSPTD